MEEVEVWMNSHKLVVNIATGEIFLSTAHILYDISDILGVEQEMDILWLAKEKTLNS